MKAVCIWKRYAAILAVATLPAAVCAQEPKRVTISQGTQIAARLASELDSGQVHIGDVVTMDVLEDLKIEDAIAIPHGSVVMGHVTKAKGARKMGRGGDLEISFETVTAGDGTRVPVSGGSSSKGKGGYGGGSLVEAGAAGLFFPPAGALLLLKHGHASEIAVGTVMAVTVTAETSVLGTHMLVAAPAPAKTIERPATEQQMVMVSQDAQPESLGDLARRVRAEKAATAKPQ